MGWPLEQQLRQWCGRCSGDGGDWSGGAAAWESLRARGKLVRWVCWDGGGAGMGARCGRARR
jgi:hypothetical protein